jgi:hypothetical protein
LNKYALFAFIGGLLSVGVLAELRRAGKAPAEVAQPVGSGVQVAPRSLMSPSLDLFNNTAISFVLRILARVFVFGVTGAAAIQLARSVASSTYGEGFWSALVWTAGATVAISMEALWARYMSYRREWWLGEVAQIVWSNFDVTWPEVAQTTRYMPTAGGHLGNRCYTLRAKPDWLDGSKVTLQIVVPTKRKDISVQVAVNGELRPAPRRA